MHLCPAKEDQLDALLDTLEHERNDAVLLRELEQFVRNIFDGASRGSADAQFLAPLFGVAGRLYTSVRLQCVPPWNGGPGPVFNRDPLQQYLVSQRDALRGLLQQGDAVPKRSIEMDDERFFAQYKALQSREFDAVVPVLHGGFLLGSFVSHLRRIPAAPLVASRSDEAYCAPRPIPGFDYCFEGKRLLVVDDAVSWGTTKKRIAACLAEKNPSSVSYLFGRVF